MIKTVVSNDRKKKTLTLCHCPACGEWLTPALKEVHHLIGNSEGGTITVCLNCHKIIEQKKEYWNSALSEKDRTPYQKSLAYVISIGDLCTIHGERLLMFYKSQSEHFTSDEHETYLFIIKPIRYIGLFLKNTPVIIRTFVNQIADDKEFEELVNRIITKIKESFNND